MFDPAATGPDTAMNASTPWSVHAWPPLLWQAARNAQLHWRHVGTCVTQPGTRECRGTGQTLWAGSGDSGEAGVAWDWVQITTDVVAMADPMSVVSNLRLVGSEGEVLTALQSARYLNEIVHALPWQDEVQRALQAA